jgi:hypothetical protein
LVFLDPDNPEVYRKNLPPTLCPRAGGDLFHDNKPSRPTKTPVSMDDYNTL